MPEFEEAKPVNTKTDYELNSDDFSAPTRSQTPHIPSPPNSHSGKKTGPQRRSRYRSSSSNRPAGPSSRGIPGAEAQRPTNPTPSENRSEERRDERTPSSEENRPPRRNSRGPRKDNRNTENADTNQDRPRQNRNNRERNRSERGDKTRQVGPRNHPRNRHNDRRGDRPKLEEGETPQDRPSSPTPRKAPVKKGILASFVSTIKGMVGIKEEVPEKTFTKYPPRKRRPRQRKKFNQGNRPNAQGGQGDQGSHPNQAQSVDGQPKKFAKKRPRRRRRRPNPEHRQQGPSDDSSPKAQD